MAEPSSSLGGSAGQQLTSLEAKLEKQQKDLKAGQRHPPTSVCTPRVPSPRPACPVGWGPGRWAPQHPHSAPPTMPCPRSRCPDAAREALPGGPPHPYLSDGLRAQQR